MTGWTGIREVGDQESIGEVVPGLLVREEVRRSEEDGVRTGGFGKHWMRTSEMRGRLGRTSQLVVGGQCALLNRIPWPL